jgi:hypothetical protein
MNKRNKDFDPCPWHPNERPQFSVGLSGCRDDPYVEIKCTCPKCDVTRRYFPTDKEVNEHYSNRYSTNLPLITAMLPKLMVVWNWRKKHE